MSSESCCVSECAYKSSQLRMNITSLLLACNLCLKFIMAFYGIRHRIRQWPRSEVTGKPHRTLIPSQDVIKDKEVGY